ncbi:MAG: hypothetical protein AAF368_17565, partial [Planctomycetota bacterium]
MAPLTLPHLLCGALFLLSPLLSPLLFQGASQEGDRQKGDKVVSPSEAIEASPQAIEAVLADLRSVEDKGFVPAL